MAATGAAATDTPAFPTPEEFVKNKFDFIIIGGGTAGLVVAARYVSLCFGAPLP